LSIEYNKVDSITLSSFKIVFDFIYYFSKEVRKVVFQQVEEIFVAPVRVEIKYFL